MQRPSSRVPHVLSIVALGACGTAADGVFAGDGGGGADADAGASPAPDATASTGTSPGVDAASTSSGDDDASASMKTGKDASYDAGPLAPAYVDYDINHVIITGQSNAVANGGVPPLSTTQPFGNLMFDTGPMSMKGSAASPSGCGGSGGCCDGNVGCFTYEKPSALVPLVEGDSFFTYPVETSAAGAGNEASFLAEHEYLFGVLDRYPRKHDMLVTNDGRSGWAYWCMRKGSCPYKDPSWLFPFPQGMQEVKDAMGFATAAGKTYVVRAVMTIHGETDQQDYFIGHPEFPLDGTDGTPLAIKDYSDGLVEWQRDYEQSIKAITGQPLPIPLLVSGNSGQNSTRIAVVAQYELDAHVRAPGKVILVGPTYHLDVAPDCRHFTAKANRRLGEYFAKVYARIVLGGETWEPVRPRSVTRASNVLTVKYHVPRPPLVFDTTRVTNPGNFGFDFVDASGAPPAITSVTITAPDTVQITLAATPVGPSMKLYYAQNQIPATCLGPGTGHDVTALGGARGNLRDSDTTPSQSGDYKDADGTPWTLWNWGVQFGLDVN